MVKATNKIHSKLLLAIGIFGWHHWFCPCGFDESSLISRSGQIIHALEERGWLGSGKIEEMKRLIKFFLFAYLLVFPFGQFTRLNLGSFGGLARFLGPEVRIYLGDVLVGLMVGIWGIWRVKMGKKGSAKAILVFAGVATLSLVINLPRLAFSEILVSSFYLFRWIVYAGLYFVVTDLTKEMSIKRRAESRHSEFISSESENQASLFAKQQALLISESDPETSSG